MSIAKELEKSLIKENKKTSLGSDSDRTSKANSFSINSD